MQIDGSTRVAGVFGSPIKHTASPAMHNAAFAALKLNWVYLPFPVDPLNLRAALLGARDMGLVGVNLTVPHKVVALDLVDDVDDEARRLGAVNTVHFVDGRMRGYNTDGYGFVRSLLEDLNLELKGKRMVVLGAGGAARAIAVKAALEGAAHITLVNRTVSRLAAIVPLVESAGAACAAIGMGATAVGHAVGAADLLVNATSVGLKSGDKLPVNPAAITPKLAVYDTIYQPPQTELLRAAVEAGAKAANGLGMLLHQGAMSLEIWTGLKAPLTVMRRALRAAVFGEEP